MNKKDLDALAGLYESVYSPEESGEYFGEAKEDDDDVDDVKPAVASKSGKKKAENAN